MMREIKFRAWEKNLKEMISVRDINFESSMINTSSAWRLISEIELMQYTGLHDKNGKEIYEGDVLQCKFYHASRAWWKNLEHKKEVDAEFERMKSDVEIIHGIVQYRKGKFFIQFSFNTLDLCDIEFGKTQQWSLNGADAESRWWDFELIGNIYENPDLLG